MVVTNFRARTAKFAEIEQSSSYFDEEEEDKDHEDDEDVEDEEKEDEDLSEAIEEGDGYESE